LNTDCSRLFYYITI